MATEYEATIDLLSQAMGSGLAYYADNQDKFQGSSKSLAELMRPMAEDMLKYRPYLLEDLKEAIAAEASK